MRFFNCDGIQLPLFTKSLRVLDISKCSCGKLPASIGKLKQLKFLSATGMQHKTIPEHVMKLSKLIYLNINGSLNISTLPTSVNKLRCLLHLDLSGCSNLCSLPNSFGDLTNLLHLNLANCYDLHSLPKSFHRLGELQYLNLSRCLSLNLMVDINAVCCLTKLQYLNLSRCSSLIHLPETIRGLKDLHTLDISGCQWIEIFPKSICEITSLKFLLIQGCSPWLEKRVRESQFKNDMLALPKFIVQRAAFGMCSNISRLQSVHPAELEIECLENVTSIGEVDVVNLTYKSALSKLALAWTPAAERFVEDEDLLRKLQPPDTLKVLQIQGYMATSFASWMMNLASRLPHLVRIEMTTFSSSVAKLFMGKRLKNMRVRLTEIAAERTHYGFTLDTYPRDLEREEISKRETTSKINKSAVVGRNKEKEEILALLESDNIENLLKYNSQIKGQSDCLDDLQSISNCLEEILDGKSCLIILDDLWENSCFQLGELTLMLSSFKAESRLRIIVTTRNEEVARKICTVAPYKLKPLSDDHCWTLFRQSAILSSCTFQGGDKNVLEEIGWEISKKCKGVPLAAQSLGFILRTKDVEEWKNVRDSDVWDGSSPEDVVLPSLKLSYYQMPPYLKICFSYCSTFPKGCEIYSDDLIQQWISLGFIQERPNKHISLEKIGEQYVSELLGMSFLQYSSLVPGSSSSLVLSKMHIRSCRLLPNDWKLLQFLPVLQVLELTHCWFYELPKSIGYLTTLRSLQIDGCDSMTKLSKWLVSLSLLHELIITGCLNLVYLPAFVQKLSALEKLEINDNDALQRWCRNSDSWISENGIKNKVNAYNILCK
ncbi:hypothetical protein OsI_07921 [Oryza sativa Indica Group]|uniref:Uncharacterized protein n=1 Tax=Oryza sativa subsp. indica TaxID=39946 RepID=B8AES7_ORYSI|nr:hypothetical protein OsI_07921 [Oryza sativa Indica Group]